MNYLFFIAGGVPVQKPQIIRHFFYVSREELRRCLAERSNSMQARA